VGPIRLDETGERGWVATEAIASGTLLLVERAVALSPPPAASREEVGPDDARGGEMRLFRDVATKVAQDGAEAEDLREWLSSWEEIRSRNGGEMAEDDEAVARALQEQTVAKQVPLACSWRPRAAGRAPVMPCFVQVS
jgi:hypothetical protein